MSYVSRKLIYINFSLNDLTVENQNAFELFIFRLAETDSCRNGGSGFFIKHS